MLKRALPLVALTMLALVLAACAGLGGTPQGSDTDATAAQQFLPSPAGYTITEADSVSDALTKVGEGATAIAGRPELAQVIGRIDGVLQCYQDVGAVASRMYTRADISTLLNRDLPEMGAVVVINQTRLTENFVPCLTQGIAAQSADAEGPCTGQGEFTVSGDTIRYFYAASVGSLCGEFQTYFDAQGS